MSFTLIFFVLGAFFRRWWGGWQNPPHLLKVFLGFLLPAVVFYLNGQPYYLAVLASVLIGLTWLNPVHGQYMRFGHPAGDKPNPTLLTCLGAFGLSYGVLPLVLVLVLICLGVVPVVALGYGLVGLLAGGWYALCWQVWPAAKKFWLFNGSYLVDGQTALGELGLGGLLLGGLYLIIS